MEGYDDTGHKENYKAAVNAQVWGPAITGPVVVVRSLSHFIMSRIEFQLTSPLLPSACPISQCCNPPSPYYPCLALTILCDGWLVHAHSTWVTFRFMHIQVRDLFEGEEDEEEKGEGVAGDGMVCASLCLGVWLG